MRLLGLIAPLLLVLATGCRHYETTVIEGAGGEDYSRVHRITTLHVLPIRMPGEILGDAGEPQKRAWRDEWPEDGARLVAGGLTEETKGDVEGLFVNDVPASGYYVVVTATRIDVGDEEIPASNFISPRPDLRTDVRADCAIINAETGALVAELSFDLGTAYGIDKPVENDFYNLGKSLGQWLVQRK
jgi:hypothetical protein